MHIIDIFIHTFIILASIQVWALIGYVVLSFLEDYESPESQLMCCLFWPLIILSWVNVQINELIDSERKP